MQILLCVCGSVCVGRCGWVGVWPMASGDFRNLTESAFVVQIPGGRKFDSVVVNGFVCTKNIAHKKVR